MAVGISYLQFNAHAASLAAGWWVDPVEGTDLLAEIRSGSRFGKALVAEKVALLHSETSEILEGHRKGQMDKNLPHRLAVEVELADLLLRIGDFGGALELDLAGAVIEKMEFNKTRADHTLSARLATGGKSY